MRAIDSKSFERVGGLDFPKFKGHVKVTLHNVHNGKNEIIEGDNIITDAVKDIFANNYLGAVDYNKMLPLFSKWFGGILCYENAHSSPSDPSDYYIKGDDVNPCIAHAGDEAPATQTIVNEDLKRGAPIETVIGANSVKYSWGWLPSQGNGQISALSLTHKDTGNAGIGSTSSAFQAFDPFEAIQNSDLAALLQKPREAGNAFAQIDDTHTLFFFIGADGWYDSTTTRAGTDSLTVYIRKLAYSKAGLFETNVGCLDDEVKFTLTGLHTTFYAQPSFYYDKANKLLWLFSNLTAVNNYSLTTVKYSVIDIENQVETSYGTIVSDQSDLAPTCVSGYGSTSATSNKFVQSYYTNIIVDGNYVYLPTGTGSASWTATMEQNVTGYKKININNQSDQTYIPFNTTRLYMPSGVKLGGLIIGTNRVVNNGVGYSCASGITTDTSKNKPMFNENGKPSFYVPLIGNESSSATIARYILASKMLNTSLYNLPSPVQKTTSQSMQIEYTLTQI